MHAVAMRPWCGCRRRRASAVAKGAELLPASVGAMSMHGRGREGMERLPQEDLPEEPAERGSTEGERMERLPSGNLPEEPAEGVSTEGGHGRNETR